MEELMINEEINYATIDQQIEKLKHQGLIIEDEEFAKRELQLHGYSNLVKSYRDPYTYTVENKKVYRSGVTFDQLWSLYSLDKNLRNAVMASMLDLEEHIKELAADTVASSFGVHQDQYLQFRNYSDKKKRKYRFSLPGILQLMRKTLDTDKDPIYHYMQKYGIVPPWILFKSIYFSTIVNFINLFKPAQQADIAAKLYNKENFSITDQELNFLMMDTLFICLEYRNLAAHGGRVYNFCSSSRLRFGEANITSLHGFSQLLFLLKLMNYQEPYNFLSRALGHQLSRHCSIFPQDTTYLGQILNLNIIPQKVVWITKNSNKYHTDQHCSGIKNAHKISLEDAKEHGYEPCKRCIKSK